MPSVFPRFNRQTARWLAALVVASTLGAAAAAPVDDSLYRDLGGQAAIQRFTDDFYDRMLLDARIAHFFDGLNPRALKTSLGAFLCVTAGGPCRYEGVDMRNAHAHLEIDKAAFNALVENLQFAMDAASVPFSVQNRLLARLAPMHRDIITR